MYKFRSLLPIAAILILISACSSSSKMTNSWKEPSYETRYFEKVATVALSENSIHRNIAELEMVKALGTIGVKGTSSAAFIQPEDTLLPDAELIKKFTDQGCDGILTVRVFKVENEKSIVTNYQSSPSMHMGFGGYYGWGMGYTYSFPSSSTSYVQETTNIFLETNFYDVSNQKLIWGGISRTTDPKSIEEIAKSYSSLVVQEMRYDKVFLKSKD